MRLGTHGDGPPQDRVGSGQLRKITTKPSAWLIERNDGLKTTLLMPPGTARLAHKIAEMFETGTAPYPVERTLPVTGIIDSGLRSSGRAVETPHLPVRYRGPVASQYARS